MSKSQISLIYELCIIYNPSHRVTNKKIVKFELYYFSHENIIEFFIFSNSPSLKQVICSLCSLVTIIHFL